MIVAARTLHLRAAWSRLAEARVTNPVATVKFDKAAITRYQPVTFSEPFELAQQARVTPPVG